MRTVTLNPGNALQTAAAFVVLSTLAMGCGGGNSAKGNSAKGTVTLNGQPVANGTLTLHYANGQRYPITLKEDGSFKVAQVPVGPAKVTVTGAPGFGSMGKLTPEEKEKFLAQLPPDKRGKATQTGPAVPEKYASPESSGLSWEITAGINQKDFPLK
jgi:hypothetical protein